VKGLCRKTCHLVSRYIRKKSDANYIWGWVRPLLYNFSSVLDLFSEFGIFKYSRENFYFSMMIESLDPEGVEPMNGQPTVHVVDDDPQVRESLNLLVRSIGLNVESYASAEEFLDRYEDSLGLPRCMVLDVRMPGLSGLGLQERLQAEKISIPIVVITGYGDVSMAVQAMDAGAVDFIEKPFSRQQLLSRVQEAIDRDAQFRRNQFQRSDALARMETLSEREREVMELMVAGKHSKQIGFVLKITDKTVAKHRVKVFKKMNVDNVAALAYLAFKFSLTPTKPTLRVEEPRGSSPTSPASL